MLCTIQLPTRTVGAEPAANRANGSGLSRWVRYVLSRQNSGNHFDLRCRHVERLGDLINAYIGNCGGSRASRDCLYRCPRADTREGVGSPGFVVHLAA